MKTIIITILTFVLLSTANAYSIESQTCNQICDHYAEIAAEVMIERQSGATASELHSEYAECDFSTAIVLAAFDVPVQETNEQVSFIVREFMNRIYVECMSECLP